MPTKKVKQKAQKAKQRAKEAKRRATARPNPVGRPRNETAERTPSGQISRAKDDPHALDIAIAYRMKIYGLTDEQAGHEKACTAHGRSWLRGEITTPCREAGERYLEFYQAMQRAIAAPIGLAVVSGNHTAVDFDALSLQEAARYAENAVRAIARHEAAKGWLLDKEKEFRDLAPLTSVELVVLKDREVTEKLLPGYRMGLATLAIGYGLAKDGCDCIRDLEAAE